MLISIPPEMSRKGFRLLLIASAATGVASVICKAYFPPPVSELPASAYDSEPLLPLAQHIGVILVFSAATVVTIAIVTAPVALFFFKKWGRTLSLWLSLVGLCTLPFLGPSLESGLGLALPQLNTMLWGAILASAYFSPVRDEFH